MTQPRRQLLIRTIVVALFVAAGFCGVTHFHFGELTRPSPNSSESNSTNVIASSSCQCGHHHAVSPKSEDNDTDSSVPTSDHCPICKILGEISSEAPGVFELPPVPLEIQFLIESPGQCLQSNSTFYFERGPPKVS